MGSLLTTNDVKIRRHPDYESECPLRERVNATGRRQLTAPMSKVAGHVCFRRVTYPAGAGCFVKLGLQNLLMLLCAYEVRG